ASRNADPVEQIVVSVTSVESSSKAFNVIPQSVQFRGTIRTLTPQVRALAETRLHAIVTATAQAFDAQANITFIKGYPPMVNADIETQFAKDAAKSVSGQCDDAPLVMGGEDFAYMLEERPGAYILVGNGDTAMVHHPAYDFNDDVIPAGCSWWVEIAQQRLPL
ncbi:MAG: M20/M25/M40 family metallo-hydrolase, partial [Pseudomonadota bacterium]